VAIQRLSQNKTTSGCIHFGQIHTNGKQELVETTYGAHFPSSVSMHMVRPGKLYKLIITVPSDQNVINGTCSIHGGDEKII
jgi:hypothetical protein